MRNRLISALSVLSLTFLLSSCFYGGYRYHDYGRPRYYAPRPYVRVVPPPVIITPRPRVYVQPRHYSYRNHPKSYRNNRRYDGRYNGRRRW
jgi:hypothetical protein